MFRNRLALAGVVLLSAFAGAALFALIQARLPRVGGDTARVETIVHDYVLAHPEILPEAMERLRTGETAKVIAANRATIVDPFPGAVGGNPQGKVTLVAYLDYACGYCRASLPALRQLIAANPDLRVVYREYPVLSDASVTAARWALAAAEQGKYQPFHDALYASQDLSDRTIQAAARVAGLDLARAAAAARSLPVEQELARNHQSGAQLGLTGTPSWVVGDQLINGVATLETFQDAVTQARKG